MKKIIISIAALLIAAGGSVGAYLAVKDKKHTEEKHIEEQLADNELFKFDPETINKITIHCPDGDYECHRDGETWDLTDNAFNIDYVFLNGSVNYASTLTAETSYEAEGMNLSDYGLEDPYVMTFYSDSDSYTLNAGDISPTGDYCYVSVEGRDKIYAIDSYYANYFRIQKNLLKNKDFLPCNDSDVIGITYKNGGETIYDLNFDQESQTWDLTGRLDGIKMDDTRVTAMINGFTRLKTNYENLREDTKEAREKYGLDKPTGEVTFRLVDGSEVNYLINDNYDKNELYTSVVNTADDQIMIFYKNDIDDINQKPYYFISRTERQAYYYNCDKFDITVGDDISASFTIDNDNKKVTLNGTEIALDSAEKAGMFQTMFDSVGIINYADVDFTASPQLKDPVLTADIHKTDGTSIKYQLTDAGNELCYVFINGKYTGGLVNISSVTGKNSITYFYDRFVELSGMAENN